MTEQIREYRFVDDATREKWGRGEWHDEPDKIQWVDEATGLDCLMHRHPSLGHWCGYVGVAEGHPFFAADYNACTMDPKCEDSYCEHSPSSNVRPHGGLTYAEFCQENPAGHECPERGICHVAFDGRPERVWWFGFDCAHSGDHSPGMDRGMDGYSYYKDRRYVEKETAILAEDLARIAKHVR